MKILSQKLIGKNQRNQDVGIITLKTKGGIIEAPYYICYGIHVAGFISYHNDDEHTVNVFTVSDGSKSFLATYANKRVSLDDDNIDFTFDLEKYSKQHYGYKTWYVAV